MQIVKHFAFTFLEFIIGLIIILWMLTLVLTLTKSTQMFPNARDTLRISHLDNLEKTLKLLKIEDPKFKELNYISSGTVYISLPDSASTCENWSDKLPQLPPGWVYRCSPNPTNIDGTGWIPIPFNQLSLFNLISLPIDPINKPPYYYALIVGEGYKFIAKLETNQNISANDGGTDPDSYEVGSNKKLAIPTLPLYINLFAKAIGWTYYEEAWSSQPTFDGGYIITGNTQSQGAGGRDAFIIKLDYSGNITWAKTIGGGMDDSFYSGQQTLDGGYIAVGYTRSFGAGVRDIFIVKLSSIGNISWAKAIGGTNSDYGNFIKQTSDGGYILIANTASYGAGGYDILVIKLDNNGNISWAKTIGGANNDYGYSIQPTSDGGYILTGHTYIVNNRDILVVKLNGSGDISWAKTMGGSGDDTSFSIHETFDNGYIILGYTSSYGVGNRDIIIIKLDSSGNISWAKTIGGINDDYGNFIQQTSDGGYIILAATTSYGAGGYDILVIKLDNNGNISWAKTIGGANNDNTYNNGLYQTSDGGYIIAGYTYSYGTNGDIFIIKLDSNGNCGNCNLISSYFPSQLSISLSSSAIDLSIASPSLSISFVSPSISEAVPNSIELCPQ